MELLLTQLNASEVNGTKDYNKQGVLPSRMRFLHPDVYTGFVPIADVVVLTDMFRSADSSLWAIRNKRGAQPPGRSGHNYGFCGDLDVDATLKLGSFKSKRALDEWMESHGWYCHRRDHRRGPEDWHYNYAITPKQGERYTSTALERKIIKVYGSQLKLTKKEIQSALLQLHMYHGNIDGLLGPLSQEAVRVFQRAWGLAVDGMPGKNTQRTLAYVTALRTIV